MSTDSSTLQQERIDEFLRHSRYCGADIPVYVGHSLFYKAFYSTRISSNLTKNRPELAAKMKKYKLDNAAMMAVTVSYLDDGSGEAIIEDADVLFGGDFHVE